MPSAWRLAKKVEVFQKIRKFFRHGSAQIARPKAPARLIGRLFFLSNPSPLPTGPERGVVVGNRYFTCEPSALRGGVERAAYLLRKTLRGVSGHNALVIPHLMPAQMYRLPKTEACLCKTLISVALF